MKKIITLLFTLIVASSLISCAKKDTQPPVPTAKPAAQDSSVEAHKNKPKALSKERQEEYSQPDETINEAAPNEDDMERLD
ncbi:hypothetical protein EDC56_3623 [Sinobacterium caligoides]|uniref:Lipoprotein n=1 Tax=Sinobacterium caligoides TaxID=933926 RepID=A0A3N2DEV1_9GAMM|nr:hypothetical protein [Sinobacterium caligoides]ROR97954.1 hypothetical protein EDC56_3623 [Sinobacterium caligoides]